MPESDADNAVPQSQPQLEAVELDAAELDAPADVTPANYATSPDPILRRELVPVVGLGGSAGGVQALQDFFEGMSVDSGMAFVVILHLLPDADSHLAEILQRTTKMPVIQVTGSVRVTVNHVYVIPPNRSLSMDDGFIRLHELEKTEGRRVAIDLFFRSLAQTHGPQSVAVVFSGTDGDGVSGLKRIKEAGGVTIAQDPEEAQYDSIPRGAIETGMVDWVLPVAEMPQRLLQLRQNEKKIQLPPVEPVPKATDNREHEMALREVLAFLRVRTGHDFTHYKRATVLRRLGRRLQVNALEDIPSYLAFLRTHPGEAGALLQDLLISVTNFFRDSDSFEALKHHLPHLLNGKGSGDHVRFWVAGCATGEEAYSLGMQLSEYASSLDSAPTFQIFASDIDEEAIAVARAGIYPATISADVSPERLRRFFVSERGHYRVKKELRDMVLFVSHNLLKDSPFSRLDLISCRNLLIYFGREAQAQAFGLFHFALRNEGLLFLGGSESADEDNILFSSLDKKHRIFRKNLVPRHQAPIPILSMPSEQPILPQLPDLSRLIASVPNVELPGRGVASIEVHRERNNVSFGELHLKLIEEMVPPSVLVNSEYDIVHLSQRAGRYLSFSGGEISVNLLKVVHPALRLELRTALFRASQEGGPVETAVLPVELEGQTRLINLRVNSMPLSKTSPAGGQRFLLVVFDEKSEDSPVPAPAPVEPVARHLEEELGHLKEHLRSIVEQYESGAEEQKASNEELQAINEELRSATEELETGKEELQSVNEELITVNSELKHKVEELSRTNSDLQNLMGATNIATIFLNRALCINRYTPSAVGLFHLIPSDLGRPLSDLRHNLHYDHLTRDAQEVMDHLVTLEYEVQTLNGLWFLVRLLPYRTVEDRIDGVVLTFVDITERKKAEQKAHRSEERFRLLVEGVEEYAIFMLDLDGRPTTWNSGVERVFGYSEAEFIGQDANQLLTPEDRAGGGMAKKLRITEETGRFVEEGWALRHDGSQFWAHCAMTALRDEKGKLVGVSKIARDMTARRQSEEELRRVHDELEERVELRTMELDVERKRLQEILEEMPIGVILAEPTERRLTFLNARIRELFRASGPASLTLLEGWDAFDAQGQPMTPEQFPLDRALRGETVISEDIYFRRVEKSGEKTELTFNVNASPLRDGAGEITAAIATLQDIAPLKQGELARQQLMARLVTIQEEERRRISRELHDQMGQQITALLMGLSVPLSSAQGDSESARRDAAQMQKLRDITNDLMEQAHRLAWELRPAALDNVGLAAAARQYVSEWGVRSGIQTDFVMRGLNNLPRVAAVETSLYRIVQEALTNVERHAKAKSVSVLLERVDETLAAIIEDDGQGFEVSQNSQTEHENKPSRLGILGMRERAELVGGTLTIESVPEQGTTVYVRVPIDHKP